MAGLLGGGSDSGLTRLKIESYGLPDCTGTKLGEIILQLNPSEISYNYSIKQEGEGEGANADMSNAQGESAPIPRFKGYNPMDLNFKTYVDATGIVPIADDVKEDFEVGGDGKIKKPSIRKYLDKLQNVLYGFDPETHGPPYLKLIWGNIFPDTGNGNEESKNAVFKAQLKECTVKILLFSLSGEPVKAEVDINLESKVDSSARPLGNSPDLTHFVDVKYGDNLTKMCKEIYNSTDYVLQVARINNLPSIYALEPGRRLMFPPLDKSSR